MEVGIIIAVFAKGEGGLEPSPPPRLICLQYCIFKKNWRKNEK